MGATSVVVFVRSLCVRALVVSVVCPFLGLPRASPFIGPRRWTGVTMDKGSSWIARWSGLPGLEAVWPSLRLHCLPTPNDVVVVLIISSQCRSYYLVVLPGAVPVMAVIQCWPPSRRSLVIRVATVATCASFSVWH